MRNKKRDAKSYAVEKTVDSVKIIEALQGDAFEPVSIETIIERVGCIPGRDGKLKPDAVRRILITLELLGWAAQVNRKWTIGKSFIRLAQKAAHKQL